MRPRPCSTAETCTAGHCRVSHIQAGAEQVRYCIIFHMKTVHLHFLHLVLRGRKKEISHDRTTGETIYSKSNRSGVIHETHYWQSSAPKLLDKCHPHFTNGDFSRSKQTRFSSLGVSRDLPKFGDFLYWPMKWLGWDNILRKTNLAESQQPGRALGQTPGTKEMQRGQ